MLSGCCSSRDAAAGLSEIDVIAVVIAVAGSVADS